MTGTESFAASIAQALTDCGSAVVVVPEIVTTEWVPLSVLPDLSHSSWILCQPDIIVTAFGTGIHTLGASVLNN